MLSPSTNTETTTREPLSLTLAERRICNADFEGSIPFRGSKELKQGGLERLQRRAHNPKDARSNRVPATTLQPQHERQVGDRLADGESEEARNDVKSAERHNQFGTPVKGATRPDQRSQ